MLRNKISNITIVKTSTLCFKLKYLYTIVQYNNQKKYYISDYLKYKIIDIFLSIKIYLDDLVKLNINVLLK